MSRMMRLANGRWSHRDVGAPNPAHRRFFTAQDLAELMHEAGLRLTKLMPLSMLQPEQLVRDSEGALRFGRVTIGEVSDEEFISLANRFKAEADEAVLADDPSVRLYKTRVELGFHSDGSDIVGLLCQRQGKAGGETLLVSTAAIYSEILRRRPDLVPLLYRPFAWDRHDEQLAIPRHAPR